MTISMDKKYRTRDGRDVRLLCADGPGEYPVVGFVEHATAPMQWSVYGAAKHGYQFSDLVEYQEPDIRTIWVNVYEDCVFSHSSKEKAEETADLNNRFRTPLVIAQPVTFEVKK